MELYKAFGSIKHEQLLPKLKAFPLDKDSVIYEKLPHKKTSTLWYKYQFNWTGQRTSWHPSMFHFRTSTLQYFYISFHTFSSIFLFLQNCDLANYADNRIMYTSSTSFSKIIHSLSYEFIVFSKRIHNNFLPVNIGRYLYVTEKLWFYRCCR